MFKKYFFLSFFLFFTAAVFGQIPPLQVNVVLAPPYSVYLADHAAGGQEQLRINIVQTDRNQPSYDFLLRIEILHQNSVLMRTRSDFRPFPLTITPGKLLTLSGNMVLPYLLEENLEFINYSRDLYYRTKALPEGTITIRVTAFDYYRPNVRVSQTAQTQFWLSKNDPPQLINPQEKQQLVIFNAAMPINFSWQSRNFSPNSILSTTYKFQLFEVYDPKSNPNQVVISQNPMYEREFNYHQTSLVYGVSEPPLTLGKQYVWRVQSIDRTGRDMYKNNGWSMAYQFQYGQDPTTAPLPPLTGLSVVVKENTATISWDYHPDHKHYEVFFHNRDMEDDQWNKVTASQLKCLTQNVAWDKEITVKVRAVNGERYSDFTYPEVFVCPKPKPRECGVPTPPLPPIDPATPLLKSLLPGTVFRCDKNFVYTVKEGKMEGDGFTGTGTVPVPLFGNRVVGITFKNVKVNEDMRYVSGAINFIERKEGGNGMTDLDKLFEGGCANNGKGGVHADSKVDFVIPDNAPIEEVRRVNDTTLSITITDAQGNPQTVEIPCEKAENVDVEGVSKNETSTTPDISGKTIQDKSGTVFSVTSDGKGGYSLTPQARQEEKIVFPTDSLHNTFAELDFNVADKEEYYKVSKLEKQYTKTLLFEERYHKLQRTEGIDRNYFLPIFSVNPGENLKITGKFISNAENIDASTIKFMTTEGLALTSQYDAATKAFTLTLSPSAVGNSQRYFAVAEHHISTSLNVPNKILVLGGFEVMTYPEKSVTLTLVPVNKIGETHNPVDKNSIEKYLNKAYGVANVKFNVKLAESFDYNGETKFMVNEKSGLLEEYTPAMLAMNNAYLEKVGDNFDKNSLYLFLLNFGAGSNDMAGFMPRQSQIGYIFLNNNKVVERTIAHELGHGLAAMSHTFNAKYGSIKEGTTNNLMDYSDSIAMQKQQWDLLHSKVVVWKVFERDKEGMQKIYKNKIVIAEKSEGLFLTPAGKPIWLDNLKSLVVIDTAEAGSTVQFTPHAVIGFTTKNNKEYFANWSQSYFNGYYLKGSNSEFYLSPKTFEKTLKQPYFINLYTDNIFKSEQITSYWWFNRTVEREQSYKGEGLIVSDEDCNCLKLDNSQAKQLALSEILATVLKNDRCLLKLDGTFNFKAFAEYHPESELSGLVGNIISFSTLISTAPAILTEEIAKERLVSASLYAGFDLGMQILMLNLMQDEVQYSDIDKLQILVSFGEGFASLWVTDFMVPVYNGFFEHGKLKENLTFSNFAKDYLIGVAVNLAGRGVMSAPVQKKLERFYKFLKEQPQLVAAKLSKWGVPVEKINDLLKSVDGKIITQSELDEMVEGLGKKADDVTEKIVTNGTTVLGKYPDYINQAEELGYKRFNIPTNIWDKMTAAEQWEANIKFLDRMINRGDVIVLSNRVTDINEVTGFFRKELEYLISKGYRLSSDGLQMIK